MIWFFAGSAVTRIAAIPLGVALLHGPLNTPDTWVMGRSDSAPAAAVRLHGATGLAGLAHALRLPGPGVVLDLERWRFTPEREQLHPVAAYARAAELARRAGKWLVATPALDLLGYGRLAAKYLRDRMAARIAPFVGAYDIQAQGLERNPSRYARFVRRVVFQLREANPRVVILAGLSTNPGGAPVTLEELEMDYRATRGIVNGYWFNIPAPGAYCPRCNPARPGLAVRFLESALRR